MQLDQWRTILARLSILGAIVCGIVGLAIGADFTVMDMSDITNWFTGGTLLAVIAIALLADERLARKS